MAAVRPPDDLTDHQRQCWKELVNRITTSLAYSEGHPPPDTLADGQRAAWKALVNRVHAVTAHDGVHVATDQGVVAAVEVSDDDKAFLADLVEQVTGPDTDERTADLWKAFLNRVVLRTLATAAAWNPALHPRDPRTGQFVERPFDVPDAIRGMSTPDIVRELASSDPDFADKVDGLDIDMDDDLQELVADVTEDTDTGGDTGAADADAVETADIAAPLVPEDVERGDDVVVRNADGTSWAGTVTTVKRLGDELVADVKKDDGSGSALVSGSRTRTMFPAGTDVPSGNIIKGDLDDGDFVRVSRPGRDDVVGQFDGRSGGDIFIQERVTNTLAEDAIQVPVAHLADPDAELVTYDTDNILDVPGVEPLPADEGGLTDVPDTDDGQELASAIRRWDDWADAAGKPVSEPIDDDQFHNSQQIIGDILDRANDPDVAREYARRTVIGDNAKRASNGGTTTPLGQRMNGMTLDNRELEFNRTTRHEMGHGVVQLLGYTKSNNRNAHDMEYWPDDVDPTDEDDFQQYLVGPGGSGADKVGWADWNEDVRREFESSDFNPDVAQSVAGDLEAGDVVRFTDPPDARVDTTAWEVTRVDPGGTRQTDRREVFMRDGKGHYLSKEVTGPDDQGTGGEFRYLGTAKIQAVASGYSDPDTARGGGDTRFIAGDSDMTVDGYREELDADGWKDKVTELTSQANRAYYKMHLKKHHEGAEEPIKDGYSTTTAAEVPSQLHETLQTDRDSVAEQAATIAEQYPRLLAAYLELWNPSPTVREVLDDVDGVTV